MKYLARSMLVIGLLFSSIIFAQDGPYSITEGKNNDLVGVVERIDIYTAELAQAESADAGGALVYDRVRIDSYNAAIDAHMDYVVGITGTVDIPHTYPWVYQIIYIGNTLDVEVTNKGMRDLLRLYLQMMEQLSKSDSMGNSNGITSHDYGRYVMLRDKINTFLVDYIDQTTPIDMPIYQQNHSVTNPTAFEVSAEDRKVYGLLARPTEAESTGPTVPGF